MKKYFLFCALAVLAACSNSNSTLNELQSEINAVSNQNDSLKKMVTAMKPGLGELMLGLQVHHNKLWFAGKEENWPLAQFEYDEMEEIIHQAETIETNRPEVKLFKPMIYGPLDSVKAAIASKDDEKFKHSFNILTSACNNCHLDTHFQFNRIEIPDRPPYSNQDFSTGNN